MQFLIEALAITGVGSALGLSQASCHCSSSRRTSSSAVHGIDQAACPYRWTSGSCRAGTAKLAPCSQIGDATDRQSSRNETVCRMLVVGPVWPGRHKASRSKGSRPRPSCTIRARPCIPLRISQWPLAIQTRTLELIGIIERSHHCCGKITRRPGRNPHLGTVRKVHNDGCRTTVAAARNTQDSRRHESGPNFHRQRLAPPREEQPRRNIKTTRYLGDICCWSKCCLQNFQPIIR